MFNILGKIHSEEEVDSINISKNGIVVFTFVKSGRSIVKFIKH